MAIDYKQAGVVKVDDKTIEFTITPEHITELKSTYIYYSTDLGQVEIKLTPEEAVALQIAMVTGKYKAGTFRAPIYSQDWREYKPKKVKDEQSEADISETSPTS